MTGIIAVAVLSVLGFAGMVMVVRVSVRMGQSIGPRACLGASAWYRFDRELASVVDRGTAELVADRLTDGPMLVPVSMGHKVLGPIMDLDLGTSCLRLRLYNDAPRPLPSGPDSSLARLQAIAFIDGRGWQVVFDGPLGPQRYLGWLVESLAPRRSRTVA
jgi:hypothetical protein